ncbi:MAG: hypothetical protein HYY21_04685 [Candidatus Tectomicrobia bacterium]|nr:hypothetical protein [Candidatus Tectomicrobia bacterium]
MAEDEHPAPERELPERWSAKQKAEIVLRLIKGEDLGALSCEIQVPAHEIEEWRRVCLEGATQGLRCSGGLQSADSQRLSRSLFQAWRCAG